MSTKSFKEQRAEAMADPVRRARIERETAAIRAGIRLYELRRARGLSQAELAKRLGVTQTRISAIERAEDLNLSTLQRYVDALGGRLKADVEFEGETIALTPEPKRKRARRARSAGTAKVAA